MLDGFLSFPVVQCTIFWRNSFARIGLMKSNYSLTAHHRSLLYWSSVTMPDTQHLTDLVARDVMTTDVVTASPDWTVDRLADFFMENDISGAPVVNDDEELVGVVSLTDLGQHQSLPGDTLPRPQQSYHIPLEEEYSSEDLDTFRTQEWDGATVEDLMTPMVFDVSEDASLQDIADTMVKGRIHRVLVTRDDELVGIITALDLLKVIRDL